MCRSVLGVMADLGGAEAVVPVLTALRDRGDRVTVLAAEPGGTRARGAGFPVRAIDRALSRERADRLLTGARPRAVITGTSWGPDRPELAVLRAAAERDIPSVAVLDFWSNYRRRFEGATGVLVLPDLIAVMDEAARRGIAAAGVPNGGAVVTGQPHFDDLLRPNPAGGAGGPPARRERLGLASDAMVVLFVSQPLTSLYGPSLGFSESDVLELVRDGLARAVLPAGRTPVLAVRPHPRDSLAPEALRVAPVAAIAASRGAAIDWVRAADLVVGISSAVLVQAALLGVRALSIQPGRRGARGLVPDGPLPEPPVTDPDAVAAALQRALTGPVPDEDPGWTAWRESQRGAIERVVAVLDRIAQPEEARA